VILSSAAWNGVLVEPLPHLAHRLACNYGGDRFRIVEAAVAGASGSTTFHFVSPEAKANLPNVPVWWDQVGSLNRSHLVDTLGPAVEPYIGSVRVPVITISELIATSGIKRVTLLHVDAEGYDAEIILSVPFDAIKIDMLLFETQHMRGEVKAKVRQHLKAWGYVILGMEKDDLALRRDSLTRVTSTWFGLRQDG